MTTSAELLVADQVTIAIDTNILIEFRSISDLPWSELAPNAESVRLIVPTKVGSEMDKHKFSSGRLRKRAAEFADLARRIEDNDHIPVALTPAGAKPKVTVEFGPLFRKADLDGDTFDLDDPDNRVVAEVVRMAETNPTLMLVADDSLPIRLARQAGLPFARPPREWRRPADGDERDELIADLKRQLGPQPKLILSFPGAVDESRRHQVTAPPTAICRDCVDRISRAAFSVDRQVSRSVLEQRYPSAIRSSFNGWQIPNIGPIGSVTAEMLDAYETEFDVYEQNVRLWASNLPRILAKPGLLLPIDIEIGNDGDRAADKVHLHAELTGAFHFLPVDYFDVMLDRLLEVPSVPAPYLDRLHLQTHDMEARRVDEFYPLDEPDQNSTTTKMISWRCEELRQGSTFSLPTLVVAETSDAKGALIVRARGVTQAKDVTLTAPLKVDPAPHPGPFHTYLRNHLELVPAHYQSALSAELAIENQLCACHLLGKA